MDDTPTPVSKVLLDNDRVVVTRWTLPRGARTGPHVHGHDYVVVPILSATLAVTMPDGVETSAEQHALVPYFRAAGVEHDVAARDKRVDFIEIEIR
jgi:quercetin dioxygenase-like cupin family protein